MFSEIVRIFYECCEKMSCVLMIDLRKDGIERHMTGFLRVVISTQMFTGVYFYV